MTEIGPGEVVWVEGGGKLRPAVVVRVIVRHDVERAASEMQFRILAPWGTGTFRPDRVHVAVEPRTAAGTALGIEKPTYFYRNNLTICDARLVQRTGRRCPPELLLQLSTLVGL